MLLSHPRFTLLYILFMVYQSDSSDGTNNPRILKLKGDDLTLYLDQISKSSKRYMIVIYNSTVQNGKSNFRRMHHMGLYYTKSKLLEEQLDRRERKRKQAIKDIWGAQHQARIDYVNQTLLNRYRPTIYLYYEMKRILRDRQVLDPLRRMIVHLEQPGNEEVRKTVMKCYRKFRPPNGVDHWEVLDTNSVVRNIVRDPFNDNVY